MTERSDRYGRIYAVVKRIPRGRVATYGQVAELADLPGCARQVGYALFALRDSEESVPWQRVVNARGRISLDGEGERRQRRLLLSEGVRRMIVNGAYWALGTENRIPAAGAKVDVVEPFEPSQYSAYPSEHWVEKALRPADLR